jgi:AcrR family transcriptional regulator
MPDAVMSGQEQSTVSSPMARAEPNGRSRRSPNWQARRNAIVDTSARVFARGGYHATGIAELCIANDLGKGALYHYIGSKEELLAAIHDRVMDEVLASADRVAAAGGSPTAQLTMLGDQLLDVIARYPDHVWVFLHEFPALTGERAEQFRRRRRTFESAVETILSAGITTGEFRDVEPRLTAMAWLGMHNYTYLWLKPDGALTAHDVAKRFADIFIGGISATGRKPKQAKKRK